MALLASNMKTIGTFFVGCTDKDRNVLKVVVKPFDHFEMTTVASIVKRTPGVVEHMER
jgi:hypothetical protein